ncbi:MAG TPA: GYD domain-containing protein [Candidatus Limnocylindrales bacterium]|nr:GYD domain-containing protein [Candidatus Limnocylindrales bacterium]
MAKYLFRASYTAGGAAGLLKEGGSGRAKAVTALAASVGGSVETMYWALGGDDFYVIADLPDAAAAAALSLTVGASGAATITTAPLFSVDEVDEIVRRRVEYRPPGA